MSRFKVRTAAGALAAAVSLGAGACSTAVNPAAMDSGTQPRAAAHAGEVADATEPPRSVAAAEPLADRVGSIVQNEILAKGVPGVSVAVLRDGKMLLERGWGVADLEKNVALSNTTIFPTGSVAKQFTAALLLKQVERGRLALTDPIGKHLAAVPPEAAAVTIEQLLNHTSGLQRAVIAPERRFESVSRETLLQMAFGDKPPASPGTKFEYSNAGYTVLGILVEKLYGKSYDAALHDEIAAPLGLTTLTKCGEPQPNRAAGSMRGSDGKPSSAPGVHHSQVIGAGDVCATAGDLVRWTHALHSGRVLSEASYQAMTTPRGAAVSDNYGLGLYVRPAQWGDKAIVHGGQALTGHVAELHWYPDHKLAVALLYNALPRVPGVSDLIPRIVLGVPLPEKKTGPADAAPQTAAPSARADGASLAGLYGMSAERAARVTVENGDLYLTPPGDDKEPLRFRSGNTYALGAPDSTTTVTFIVENGIVSGLEVNANGRKRTLKKIQ
jgi:CubicO group peptidase (beta-lactamase class C family)